MSFSRGPREALMSGKIIPTIWGRDWRFPGIRPSLTLWSLMVGLGTVLVPLGMPFNSLGGSDGKESAWNAGDSGLILGWEDPLEKGLGYPPSILCLENPMDRGAWRSMGSQRIGHDCANNTYTKDQRIKDLSKLIYLPSWTHLILICLSLVPRLCHSFKGCALPPSLLFQ